ncbi:MAG: hypothetical protein ACRCXM_10160, partial [Beijerinckiaceae bacterium]
RRVIAAFFQESVSTASRTDALKTPRLASWSINLPEQCGGLMAAEPELSGGSDIPVLRHLAHRKKENLP